MLTRLTLADGLTWSRMAAVPAMCWCAAMSRPGGFSLLLLAALVTDAIDGPVARALGTASARGGQLDSLADALVYLTAPLLASWVYPGVRETLGMSLMVIAVCFAIPPLAGWLRFGRLPSYHTRLARVVAVAMGVALAAYVQWSLQWPVRVAATLLVLSTLEEVLITWRLPQWTHPVPSLWHAARLARAARPTIARGPAAYPLPEVRSSVS
jgi:CDP-diacylglycerol--glycerol-3-phosphate 3-phosphatidyltransferase